MGVLDGEDVSDREHPQRGPRRAQREREDDAGRGAAGPVGGDRRASAASRTARPSRTPSRRRSSAGSPSRSPLAPIEWDGYKINLIDTPGYADFMGEVEAALAVADLAVFVVSAVDGVEVQTEAIWNRCAQLGVPRMVFVNKEDKERADFHRVLDQLRATLGSGFAPLELPLGEEASFHGVADILSDQAFEYEPDGKHHSEPLPADLADEEHRVHDELVEEIVSGDDEQLERYLSGEVPTIDELERTLAHEVLDGTEFPVVLGSALTGVGIDRLADFICEIGPSPADRPVTVDRRRPAGRGHGRRGRAAAGVRVPHHRRPLRRAALAVQGAVGHDQDRRPPRQRLERRRRAPARPVPPAGQGADAGRLAARRRPGRRGQAGQHPHRRHAGPQGLARAGHRQHAAAGRARHRGPAPDAGRRRQAGRRPPAPPGRGPGPRRRAQRGDPPDPAARASARPTSRCRSSAWRGSSA